MLPLERDLTNPEESKAFAVKKDNLEKSKIKRPGNCGQASCL